MNQNLIKSQNTDLKTGFALKIIERNRLNKNQKDYILEKFLPPGQRPNFIKTNYLSAKNDDENND